MAGSTVVSPCSGAIGVMRSRPALTSETRWGPAAGAARPAAGAVATAATSASGTRYRTGRTPSSLLRTGRNRPGDLTVGQDHRRARPEVLSGQPVHERLRSPLRIDRGM